jgi:ribosome-associated protein
MPDLIEIAREAALDKRAEEVTTIPLEGRSVMADAFLICSGRSNVQNRAIADAIEQAAAAAGYGAARVEGYSDGHWILVDLGSVIVHVFTPEQRAFYNLERLWGGATPASVKESGP